MILLSALAIACAPGAHAGPCSTKLTMRATVEGFVAFAPGAAPCTAGVADFLPADYRVLPPGTTHVQLEYLGDIDAEMPTTVGVLRGRGVDRHLSYARVETSSGAYYLSELVSVSDDGGCLIATIQLADGARETTAYHGVGESCPS